MVRGTLDRLLVGLALLVLRGFYRCVEVEGRERLPRGRPTLIVANHFNGLADAAILVHVFGRVPRFLAKATLWERRWARPFLALAGLLPVQRRQDAPGTVDNRQAFARSYEVLSRRRGLVAIFPEGVTHDAPALAPIRTGAARLALGARAWGAEGLAIVPVGMAFDDKLALRSRALARVGWPLDLDEEIDALVRPGEPADETNRAAVQHLTQEIERRLRAVSPDYRDIREARVLSRAAEIAERSEHRRGGVPMVEQEALAQRLAYAPREVIDELTDALARYHLDLELLGLRDHQLVPGYTAGQLLVGFLKTAALVALMAPFAVVGAAVHLLPYWLVVATSRAVRKPVMKATTRFLVAVAVFPLTWLTVLWLSGQRGLAASVLLLVGLPATGIIAVACFERLVRARRAWRGWQALRDRRALLDDILANRERLVTAVRTAAEAAPARPAATAPDRRGGAS
ncbi:MAG TPA: 1-acyl-sn-glycerol-3-phosphate acyltransferase [Egibacteraceae bacterium]|nr:1-acyl-sn-glycerol-3-phosphate acyltransferase [Egibacteraceae bacterium]